LERRARALGGEVELAASGSQDWNPGVLERGPQAPADESAAAEDHDAAGRLRALV
jgi:hypothetical protein